MYMISDTPVYFCTVLNDHWRPALTDIAEAIELRLSSVEDKLNFRALFLVMRMISFNICFVKFCLIYGFSFFLNTNIQSCFSIQCTEKQTIFLQRVI